MNNKIWWTVLAASFGFALIQIDVTIVNVALPRIAQSLGAKTAELQWIVDSYVLIFAALLLSAGFLGDRFGARRVYLAGLALFVFASLACGLAGNALWLIAARTVQGIAAAAMLPCSLTLLNHAAGHDPRLRAKAVAWWSAASAIATAAGPIAGGVLLSLFSWRSIFFVNLPIGALGAWLILEVEETGARSAGRSLDLIGQALAIVAMGAITAAVIEARPLGLRNIFVIGAAIIGILAAIGFVIAERRSRAPMLPLELFHEGAFTPAVLYGVIVNLTYYGMVFVLTLYLQKVLGYDPLYAGLAYLPLTGSFFLVNIITGWWVGHHGSRMPMVTGAIIDAVGFALLLPLTAASSYWTMLPAFALIPVGMGLGVPAMTTAVLASVHKGQSGVASGALNAARQAGGAIGVALFGALASGDSHALVSGLHASSVIAVFLLVTAAVITAWAVPRGLADDRVGDQQMPRDGRT